jgi:hypothetical protein
LRKDEFEVGETFFTATGLWLCMAKSDLEIRAKQVWHYTSSGKKAIKNPPELTFNNRHWPACRKISRVEPGQKRIPCFRCYDDNPDVPCILLGLGDEKINGKRITRGTSIIVCERCRLSNEKSCLSFGKFKWICPCGANIWQDDLNTDYKCINCGRERGFWTPVEND